MVGYDDRRGGEVQDLLVHVETDRPVLLSLYFVARSDAHKHAIRVMDYHTLDLVAPTTLIQNYTSGIWWTLSTERAVRLRLSNILGIRL